MSVNRALVKRCLFTTLEHNGAFSTGAVRGETNEEAVYAVMWRHPQDTVRDDANCQTSMKFNSFFI